MKVRDLLEVNWDPSMYRRGDERDPRTPYYDGPEEVECRYCEGKGKIDSSDIDERTWEAMKAKSPDVNWEDLEWNDTPENAQHLANMPCPYCEATGVREPDEEDFRNMGSDSDERDYY